MQRNQQVSYWKKKRWPTYIVLYWKENGDWQSRRCTMVCGLVHVSRRIIILFSRRREFLKKRLLLMPPFLRSPPGRKKTSRCRGNREPKVTCSSSIRMIQLYVDHFSLSSDDKTLMTNRRDGWKTTFLESWRKKQAQKGNPGLRSTRNLSLLPPRCFDRFRGEPKDHYKLHNNPTWLCNILDRRKVQQNINLQKALLILVKLGVTKTRTREKHKRGGGATTLGSEKGTDPPFPVQASW